MLGEARALAAVEAAGIHFTVTRHGPVRSLEEAAAARGVRPGDIVKSLVVRRADDDFLFVLVPGDRQFSWPKLTRPKPPASVVPFSVAASAPPKMSGGLRRPCARRSPSDSRNQSSARPPP